MAEASELAEALLLALGRLRAGEGIQRGGAQGIRGEHQPTRGAPAAHMHLQQAAGEGASSQGHGTPPSLRLCLHRLSEVHPPPPPGSSLGLGLGMRSDGLGGSVAPLELLLLHLEVHLGSGASFDAASVACCARRTLEPTNPNPNSSSKLNPYPNPNPNSHLNPNPDPNPSLTWLGARRTLDPNEPCAAVIFINI